MMSPRRLQRRRAKQLPKLCLQLFVISFCVLSLVNSKRTAPRNKKPVINWNNSYYEEPFSPCKKSRLLNPVEAMRAQTIAANIFRRCATKLVVKYATKYRFPSYAIYHGAKHICMGFTYAWASAADDGSLIAPASFRSQTLLDFFRKLVNASDKGKRRMVIRHRNETFEITAEMMADFNEGAFPCIFPTEFLFPLDGDYMKHVAEHWMKMLL